LKFNLFFEKFNEGTIKSPLMVDVSITLDFLSLAEETFNVYYSVIIPFFIDKALNWNMKPCLDGILTLSGKIWKTFSSSS